MTDTAPNILFLFPDQWRWDWLGCHGTVGVRTPHLDALAARGVRFTHCRVNSPVCSPSRACLSTLRRYENAGVPDNRHNTVPEDALLWRGLRDQGYRVATCGKDDLHKADGAWSRDGWMPILGRYGFTEARAHAGKWDAYGKGRKGLPELLTTRLAQEGQLQAYFAAMEAQGRDKTALPGAVTWPLPERLHTDSVCGANACALIENFPKEGPWALWVNFPGPHEPHDPPAAYAAKYAHVDFPPPVAAQGDTTDHLHRRRQYAANCEHIDTWVGRILDAVERRGETGNTLVVLASDHGDMMGDHGRYHKSVAHEGSLRVPCIIAGPGVERRGISTALVELIDLGATILEAAGVPRDQHREARSLWPLLDGSAADDTHRSHQHAALKDWCSVTTATHKLVVDPSGSRLYDLVADPGETSDIAAARPDVVADLAART